MRWQSRLALGALVLTPSVVVPSALAANAAAATAQHATSTEQRSVSVQRPAEPAVIAAEPTTSRSSHALRPVVGDLPTSALPTIGAWTLVGVVAALMQSVWRRPAARGRAPPLRFL